MWRKEYFESLMTFGFMRSCLTILVATLECQQNLKEKKVSRCEAWASEVFIIPHSYFMKAFHVPCNVGLYMHSSRMTKYVIYHTSACINLHSCFPYLKNVIERGGGGRGNVRALSQRQNRMRYAFLFLIYFFLVLAAHVILWKKKAIVKPHYACYLFLTRTHKIAACYNFDTLSSTPVKYALCFGFTWQYRRHCKTHDPLLLLNECTHLVTEGQ